jgi:uncharacterized protein (DUF1330 family)
MPARLTTGPGAAGYRRPVRPSEKGSPVSAYFVVHNRIVDDEAMQTYIPKAVESIMAYGGEILVVADDSEVLEGATDLPRTIVIKFESREQALKWYRCAEYEEVRPIRLAATEGFAVLVDGFEMPG